MFKSNQLGFENKIIDIETTVLRSTKKTYSKEVDKAYGRGYRALGYHPLFVLVNLLSESKKSISGSFYQLIGYMNKSTILYDSEIRKYIKNRQKKALKNKIKKFFRIPC